MTKLNTEENLAQLAQLNSGKRNSLRFDEDFNYENYSGTLSSDISNINKDKDVPVTPSGTRESDSSKELYSSSHYSRHLDYINTSLKRRVRAKSSSKEEILNKTDYRSVFGDIEFYTIPATVFDSKKFKDSDFFGIYVLFWLGTAFLMLNSIVSSHIDMRGFFNSPVVKMLRRDVIKIGLTDLAMYLSSYEPFLIQAAIKKGYITWDREGCIIETIYQVVFFVHWLYFASPKVMDFAWSAKVFLVLHSLVMIMKMHSYSFYNGYLWRILTELKISENYLKRYQMEELRLPKNMTPEEAEIVLLDSISFCKFELSYQRTKYINPKEPKDDEEINDNLNENSTSVSFPDNISWFNYFEYSMFPTLVYTLSFPRTKRIRWDYVFEKTCGVFGIIFLMAYVAQKWLYPIVNHAQMNRNIPFSQKIQLYPFILLDMIPPFLMEYLFTFFLIWDFILNVVAEVSMYADRDFYGPWWSCADWSEYARIWNRPVHKFLLRHVYHSSISALKLNKSQAILTTFIISSIVHELVMYVIFRTFRGYLLLLQMSQLPLVMFSNTKFMKNRKVLGILICWFGFISGPSIICTAYLMF